MKFDELFNTLMEACGTHGNKVKEAHCGTHGEKAHSKKIEEESDEDVAARTPPRKKLNKADFLPKKVRDKINKEK